MHDVKDAFEMLNSYEWGFTFDHLFEKRKQIDPEYAEKAGPEPK